LPLPLRSEWSNSLMWRIAFISLSCPRSATAHLLSLEQAPKPHTVNTQIVLELRDA
jgi:hypothetical protein